MDNPDPEMESPEFDPASLRVCRICAESTTEDVLDSNDGCCMNLECRRRNASNKEKQMPLLEKRNNDMKAGAMKKFVVSKSGRSDIGAKLEPPATSLQPPSNMSKVQTKN